jgi:hypothetical protein
VAIDRDEDRIGISEEEQGDDPESIAAWIAWMNGLQPFLTPEEDEAWRKARAEQKAFELSKWEERGERIRKLFE